MSEKEATFTLEGRIDEALANAMFRVTLENGVQILAYGSGRMKRNHIRILCGDRVQVEMSPYDTTKGRIVYRYK